MGTYHPDQRSIRIQVYAPTGWIGGVVHPPKTVRLADWLGRAGEFVTLTKVRLAPGMPAVPFLALHRRAIQIVVPPPGEHDVQARTMVEETAPRRVWCLLPGGWASGVVDVNKNLRVSDFFLNKEGFFVLRDGRLHLGPDDVERGVEQLEPVALVRLEAVVGVSELGG